MSSILIITEKGSMILKTDLKLHQGTGFHLYSPITIFLPLCLYSKHKTPSIVLRTIIFIGKKKKSPYNLHQVISNLLSCSSWASKESSAPWVKLKQRAYYGGLQLFVCGRQIRCPDAPVKHKCPSHFYPTISEDHAQIILN